MKFVWKGKEGKALCVLHGVADRDPDELVCQFFENWKDLYEFKEALPGMYDILILDGIDVDDFKIHPGPDERHPVAIQLGSRTHKKKKGSK